MQDKGASRVVKVEFIDGTEETLEPTGKTNFPYMYDMKSELFKVPVSGYYVTYPREFVKSIRYIEI